MKSLFLFLLLAIVVNVNAQEKNYPINILNQKHLLDLASASGVGYLDNTIYVIGDDTPYLFELDNQFNITQKSLITGNDKTINGRVYKDIKSDFESLEIFSHKGEKLIMILSSGSMRNTRDTLHIISLKNKEKILSKNVRPIFELIRNEAGFQETDEINIEALAINKQNVYMLQRGNNNDNLIVSFKKDQFLKYLNSNSSKLPKVKIFRFRLPEMENTVAGFSGCCVLADNSGLFFTASLEASIDAYSDGEILGSYIGIVKFDQFSTGESTTIIVESEGKVLKTKLEGISIKSLDNNKVKLITVSDNDDGTSWLFELELNVYSLFNKD